MRRLKKFKPAFWDHQDFTESNPKTSFNFRRKWKLIVLFTSFMALLPLFVMTLVDFSLTRRIIEDEVKSSMSKILQAAVGSISSSTDLKKSALDYINGSDQGEDNDIFIVNEKGTLLTDSFYYGSSGTPNAINTKAFKEMNGIKKDIALNGKPVISGYARIKDSQLILVLTKCEEKITDLWLKPRFKLVGYLAVSIVLILLSIMGTATYLVRRIHSADRKRSEALHHAEYAKKLASIGRLASGVAHEINNPLAIINQKTGLMMDLLTMKKDYSSDERLVLLANDVLDTVKRCSTITRRLLDFARHMEPSIESVDIGEVIGQVLAFLEKEAEHRRITISVDNKEAIPNFECDKGSLQQIFLNLFENAFAAMEDGGQLTISIKFKTKDEVAIIVSDNGSGIAAEDIDKIFEPFFSSKNHHWGSGLGLSITYGLVKEINGDIRVKSRVGKGTRFTVTLPLKKVEVANGKR
ncbi:MAG: GHKL domain-containing protein [Desulfobacula sp.]|jgi:signal transduction histidine kinase|uniref:sensor histidine kinase n=1 Tax=Desulfobacula sp. TaxID=2593537 RepID=UPI001D90FAB5|nr:GHKL domain-containing protein [Desulfobacula sp.]MBT3485899.1 GHKL domain-containing protein [Desulfobacula sp.]MBT3805456.1 GHKL domain-containing protein [Desulfobacula sp.]MBT4025975.1 GHKL domain-containing protein [Desulfobacula sp.]MBT4199106.1 GHKL domain-containing protein [Desulfobacula sp.]